MSSSPPQVSFESTLALPVAGEPFSLPLASPDRAVSAPAQRPEPTPEQHAIVARILDRINEPEWKLPTRLATLKHSWRVRDGQRSFFGLGSHHRHTQEQQDELEPLQDREKMYLSLEQVHRACRAVKWDEAAALKRLEEIVVWRREYGVDDMQPQLVSKEGETGKELVFGYDRQCRPVLYMASGPHRLRRGRAGRPRQIDFVIWTLERTIDLCPATVPATEMLCLCIDFGASQKVKAPPTSLGQAKKVYAQSNSTIMPSLIVLILASGSLDILQLVGPFVDPRTKEKIRFLEKPDATDLIPPHQLQKMFGGEIDFQYDHDKYFMALHKLCMERRAANLERWRKYGNNKCGLSETVIRGAVVPGQESATSIATTAVVAEPESVSSPTDSHATDDVADVFEEVPRQSSVATSTATTVAGDDDVPSDKMASIQLDNSKSDATNAKEVFVDAPVASEDAVKVAVPATA
ncbi:Phosphatidylinositol transfer protein (PITP) [Microbotryomycetes sp. JL201]|nr:Phosphatidylinositol transfer protein (PITP) [Microbotryomycetes sp. JL201]